MFVAAKVARRRLPVATTKATGVELMTVLNCVCTYEPAIHSRQPSAHCADVPRQHRLGEYGNGQAARLSVQAVREAGLSDRWTEEVRYWWLDLSVLYIV